MSESTLSLSYEDLLKEVGGFLGYGVDGFGLDPDRLNEVDRYVQSGVRQFYYPPAMQGVEAGYAWSFMKPSATIVAADSTETSDLPDDFGNMAGIAFYYPQSTMRVPIAITSIGGMQALKSRSEEEGTPTFACIRYKESDGTNGHRSEVVWWKTPDTDYTLSYTYEAYTGKLTEDRPYPLGGMRYSEVIVESCLAIAEQRANDEKGLHTDLFNRLLASAVEMDRRYSAKYYGQMGSPDTVHPKTRRNFGETYPITYKGETW